MLLPLFAPSVTEYIKIEDMPTEAINVQQELNLSELEGVIQETFPEAPRTMLAIAKCESGLRQFTSEGKVVTSHTADRGVFQINEIWNETAEKLGYNVDDTQGNILMARHVYDVQGLNAWVCYKKGIYLEYL